MALLQIGWFRPWLEPSATGREGWRWVVRLTSAGLAVLLMLAGLLYIYTTRFNWVRGTVQSSGPGLNNWRSTPYTCARDPQDGRPPGSSTTVVSMLWYNTTQPERGPQFWSTTPDAPLRLDLSSIDGQTTALLTTAKTISPTVLDPSVCPTLDLHTWPEAPLVPQGKPALGGVLTLNCSTAGRHIQARLRFDHCDF